MSFRLTPEIGYFLVQIPDIRIKKDTVCSRVLFFQLYIYCTPISLSAASISCWKVLKGWAPSMSLVFVSPLTV